MWLLPTVQQVHTCAQTTDQKKVDVPYETYQTNSTITLRIPTYLLSISPRFGPINAIYGDRAANHKVKENNKISLKLSALEWWAQRFSFSMFLRRLTLLCFYFSVKPYPVKHHSLARRPLQIAPIGPFSDRRENKSGFLLRAPNSRLNNKSTCHNILQCARNTSSARKSTNRACPLEGIPVGQLLSYVQVLYPE